jgi:hypothetical protein
MVEYMRTLAERGTTKVALTPVYDGLGWPPLRRAGADPRARACCCPAHPQYQVVLVPTLPGTEAPELLLCAHHLRVSRQRLRQLGSAVYDLAGWLIESPT